METVNSFHKQNKNISSSLLLCRFKTHANNPWVRELLLFISIPVPSQSFVTASQNPPAKLYLKPKHLYAWNFLMKRTSVHINPLMPEGNCLQPIPNSLAFWGIFQSKRKHKKKHICAVTTDTRSGALSIQPNIPVWNSGYSIRRMEQYFPVRWTNQSQVIRFQVSRENTRSNRGFFYLCFLALGLLGDSEVEINDVLGEGDNITFIVRI